MSVIFCVLVFCFCGPTRASAFRGVEQRAEFFSGFLAGVFGKVEGLAVAFDLDQARRFFVEVDGGLAVGKGGADVIDRVLGVAGFQFGVAFGHPIYDLRGALAFRTVFFKPVGGGFFAILAVDADAGGAFFELEAEGHQGSGGLDVGCVCEDVFHRV